MQIRKTLGEIADFIDGELIGDRNLVITGLCGIQDSKEGDLTFLANSKYFPLAQTTKASAIFTPPGMEVSGKSIIRTENPSLAFSKIASWILGSDTHRIKGIHSTAIVPDSAVIGKNVAIGPYTVLEENVRIDDHTVIGGGCYIGHHSVIGARTLIYPNVTVRERTTIGKQVIIHSGTVIGADGFGFTMNDGAHEKIPQLGIVVIEDDVEIGACVTIDRARFDQTRIGRGTKIDNLVQIAHNVIVEENCLIVAQAGISGSVLIKKNVILAGQSGVTGHLTVGEGVVVMAKAGLTKSVPPHTTVWGWPAKPHKEAKKINAHYQRLPHYVETLHDLKKRIETLEAELKRLSSLQQK